MIINHNMSALFADRQLKVNGQMLDKNMEKLSSGVRIVRAGDDASGLAVSEKMRSQIRGLRQASTNAANVMTKQKPYRPPMVRQPLPRSFKD